MLRFLSLVVLTVSAIRLFAAGLLTPGLVILALVCGVVIMAMGPKTRVAAMAVAGLVFLTHELGGANAHDLMAHILAIAVVLFAMYLMLRSVFRRAR